MIKIKLEDDTEQLRDDSDSAMPCSSVELKLRIYSRLNNNQKPVITSVWIAPDATLADLRKDEISQQLLDFELPQRYMFQYYDHEEKQQLIVSPQNEHRYRARDLAALQLGILPSLQPTTCEQQEGSMLRQNQAVQPRLPVAKEEPESEDDIPRAQEEATNRGRKPHWRLNRQKYPQRKRQSRHKPWRMRQHLEQRRLGSSRGWRKQKQPYCSNKNLHSEVVSYKGGSPWNNEISKPTTEWWFEIQPYSVGSHVRANITSKAVEWCFTL